MDIFVHVQPTVDGRHSFPILQVPGYEVSNRVLYFQQGVPQQNIQLIKQQLWIPGGVKRKELRLKAWTWPQMKPH